MDGAKRHIPDQYKLAILTISMKTLIAAVISLLLLQGCSPARPSPMAERLLVETGDGATVTICYPKSSNLILSVHSVGIMVDGTYAFFLHGGERITFPIPPGTHEIGVSDSSSAFFTHLETLPFTAEMNGSNFFETYPVFEGITFVPYGFIPIPGPDIRFKLFEVDKERAAQLKTKQVDANERIMPEQ